MQHTGFFLLIIVWTYNDLYVLAEQSRCKPLFMCPTFCMKMKNGCYICSCGSFSNYLKTSANEISRVSNEQSSQTGSQLSTYTSGYDVDAPKQTGTGTGFLDYREMFRSMVRANKENTNKGQTLLHDDEIQRYLFQNGGSLNPDFTGFGQRSGNMPGMSCAAVSRYCPASCLTTDVYSGCIQCHCDISNNIESPRVDDLSKNKATTPTVLAPDIKEQLTTKSPWKIELHTALIPFKIPTPAPLHSEQKIPTLVSPTGFVITGPNFTNYQGRFSPIKIPTLPPNLNHHSTRATPFEEIVNILDLQNHNTDTTNRLKQQHRLPIHDQTALNYSEGDANARNISDKETGQSFNDVFVRRLDDIQTKMNNTYTLANPSNILPIMQPLPFHSVPSTTTDNVKSDANKGQVTHLVPSKQYKQYEAIQSSAEQNRNSDHLIKANKEDGDIFDFLNEVIDNNERPTGGFYGNVINRGISLEELTHNEEGNDFNSFGHEGKR